MLAVKDKQSYVTSTWYKCTWHVFIIVMTLLWFSIKAKLVLRLVVIFLFRGVCGEFVLFFLAFADVGNIISFEVELGLLFELVFV